MKHLGSAALLVILALGASACVVGDQDEGEGVTDEDAEQTDAEQTDPETLTIEAYYSKSARVWNGHGTAFVYLRYEPTLNYTVRTAGLVDENTGGTFWRIKNYLGTVVDSGFHSSGMGGSIGGRHTNKITIQILNNSSKLWVTALSY